MGHIAMTRLGFGGAWIGNLLHEVPEAEAAAAVSAAWDAGVRYFDTAPHYGLGLSERRLGAALSECPRDEIVISTKVGRMLVPNPAGASERDLANGFDVPAGLRRVWDFSADGVRRSLAESLERLGMARVDIALIHDPDESDDHEAAFRTAVPALVELRAQGAVRSIGVGSKSWQTLLPFVLETDIDTIMLAGRYTLLEQPALGELLPACQRRGVSVLNAGVFNSGILTREWPEEDLTYEYSRVPPALLDRARKIASVCRRHGTSLPHAALVFAAAHPSVASIVVGAERAAHILRAVELLAAPPPPAALWEELRAEGLLRPDAPTPS
jgi:D-threo-aldose 1-dehydrogenase